MNAKNNSKMELVLLVANSGASEMNGTNVWKQVADFWIAEFFNHPRYLKVDGKPVIMIYKPVGADKEGLYYLQEASKKPVIPEFFLQVAENVQQKVASMRKTYIITYLA
jgi:hypothetical protein